MPIAYEKSRSKGKKQSSVTARVGVVSWTALTGSSDPLQKSNGNLNEEINMNTSTLRPQGVSDLRDRFNTASFDRTRTFIRPAARYRSGWIDWHEASPQTGVTIPTE